jgi:hypothetical protein
MALSAEQKLQRQIDDMQKIHKQKLIDLYNNYYDKAMTDCNAFRAFNDVSKELFKDGEESELQSILNGVKADSDE